MVSKRDYHAAVEYASELAREGKGALFVLSDKSLRGKYELLYGRVVRPFEFSSKAHKPVVKALASLDGAVIVVKGKVADVGARIKATKTFRGFGTRHSAAYSISLEKGVVSVLSSEEAGRVRIFKDGKLMMEIDPRTMEKKGVIEKIADILSNPDIPILTSSGLASLALGVNPLTAAIVFAGSYVVTSAGITTLKEFLRKGLQAFQKQEKATRPAKRG